MGKRLAAARVRRPRQLRLAEWVYRQLATALLEGDFAAGEALPPENELAAQFGVSRMILRQALHRLADLGLLAVRQGGATRVLALDESSNLQILELLYRLAPSTGTPLVDPRDAVEKQFLQGLSLVEIAERRATAGDLAQVCGELDRDAGAVNDDPGFARQEVRCWRGLARAGHNRILQMEVNWWYQNLPERPRAEHLVPSPLAARLEFYRQLAVRLRARDRAAAYYLEAVRPILRALSDPLEEPIS